MPQLMIETHRVGPLGFYAEVRADEPAQTLFRTRIYEEREVVENLARAWIADNQWPPVA